MPRTPIALLAGLSFLALYLVGILALSDHVLAWHWIIQAVFFLIAGVIWVLPIHWLMLWAAGVRRKRR